jgi:hypothetical protein
MAQIAVIEKEMRANEVEHVDITTERENKVQEVGNNQNSFLFANSIRLFVMDALFSNCFWYFSIFLCG